MANQYKNKVVYGGTTLIDLTSDTVTAADLRTGVTAHDASGAVVTGTATSGLTYITTTQDSHGGDIVTITTGGVIDITQVNMLTQDENGYLIIPSTATLTTAVGVSF